MLRWEGNRSISITDLFPHLLSHSLPWSVLPTHTCSMLPLHNDILFWNSTKTVWPSIKRRTWRREADGRDSPCPRLPGGTHSSVSQGKIHLVLDCQLEHKPQVSQGKIHLILDCIGGTHSSVSQGKINRVLDCQNEHIPHFLKVSYIHMVFVLDCQVEHIPRLKGIVCRHDRRNAFLSISR